jgi:hypothetical protein
MITECFAIAAGVALGVYLLRFKKGHEPCLHETLVASGHCDSAECGALFASNPDATGSIASCACGDDCKCKSTSEAKNSNCACGNDCKCSSLYATKNSNCACGDDCKCKSTSATKNSNCACGDDRKCKSTSATKNSNCACGDDCKCGDFCSCETSSKSKRDIASFISGGVNSIVDLKDALQCAAELEFSTIPPYLCAEWSIKADDSAAASIIHEIVVQEMFHLGLVCNMLSAIGGRPSLTHKTFVPTFPRTGLPGGVHPELRIDLLPLCPEAIKTFMQIEYPDGAPVALTDSTYPSIGAFYKAIAAAFQTLHPTFVEAKQLEMKMGVGEVFAINSVSDALRAIELICEQGEGSSQSPLPPDEFFSGEPAHYYAFKQLLLGKCLQKDAHGQWHFDGVDLPLPEAYQFSAGPASASQELQQMLGGLLTGLESVWTEDPANFRKAMHHMMHLRHAGVSLVRAGIRPEFAMPAK